MEKNTIFCEKTAIFYNQNQSNFARMKKISNRMKNIFQTVGSLSLGMQGCRPAACFRRDKKTWLHLPMVILACTPIALFAQTVEQVDEPRLFALLEDNSYSLRVAKSAEETQKEGSRVARSMRLPDVKAQMTVGYNGNVLMTDRNFTAPKGFSQPHISNSLVVEAEQTIYTGGALTAGMELADTRRQQASNNVDRVRQEQRFLAMAQLLELAKTDHALEVYDRNMALTEQLIQDITARREQGLAIRNDITRYELQLEKLKLARRQTEDRRTVVNHDLCSMLGMEGIRLTADSTVYTGIMAPEGALPDWLETARQQATAIRAAQLGEQEAIVSLKLARSGMRPKVSLFASDSFSGPYQFDIPPIDNNFNVWQVGIGVRYELSSLFKQNRRVRQATLQLNESRDSRLKAAEQVDNSVHEAYVLYTQSYEDLNTKRKSAQLARENYDVVCNRYLNGMALITDMTDASNVLLSAELDETDARVNIAFALYRLRFMAGKI